MAPAPDGFDARLLLWAASVLLVLAMFIPAAVLVLDIDRADWKTRPLLAGGATFAGLGTVGFAGLAAVRAWLYGTPDNLSWAMAPLPYAVLSAALLLPLTMIAGNRVARGRLFSRLFVATGLALLILLVNAATEIDLRHPAVPHINPAALALGALLAILLLAEMLRRRGPGPFGVLARAAAGTTSVLALQTAQGETPLAQWGPSSHAALAALGIGVVLALGTALVQYRVNPTRDPHARPKPDPEARIRHLTEHDLLTNLANRAALQSRIEQVAGAEQHFAVLHLSLDRFKSINDMLGPAGGDQVLSAMAARLSEQASPADLVARIGGDEFAVLLIHAKPEAASDLAARLLDRLAMPLEIEGQKLTISVSLGIVLHPQDGEDAGTLLTNADIAAARAKASGGATFRFFEEAIDSKLRERRLLARDLRLAMTDPGQLQLLYQPLVACASGRVTGFEALLRWNHPLRGEIPPDKFIPIAEEHGLIHALGRWVLETACTAAATWPAECMVSVNLSPLQLHRPNLPLLTRQALQRSGLPPERLELEVTEGLLVDSPEEAAAMLRLLKDEGVRIALDDFGSGYSALHYLRRYPFDKLKIDRSFIMAMDQEDAARAIVRAMLSLARGLGLATAAEGVETPRQLALLQIEGCGEAQGWLIGRPMPAAAVPGFLNARAGAVLLHKEDGPARPEDHVASK